MEQKTQEGGKPLPCVIRNRKQKGHCRIKFGKTAKNGGFPCFIPGNAL